MSTVEILVVLALSLMIMCFFIPILWKESEEDVQSIVVKIKAMKSLELVSKNGILTIVDTGRITVYDPHENKTTVYRFPFSFQSEGSNAGEDVTFMNGFVSTAGTVYGEGWRITVEPVTGRMRIYRGR
ncbi:hypothetical protein [Thermotoga sp. SG1]|uniref:hypothetical protein n=1 Tax=Thermotoga sp. SG1 TaxID=126739 RepID=UPI000C7890A0|nr:hypothetical protein [Thermotoga sp. SG1]PLV57627.1 hypothetical protein AS006_01785 [Thermotoga sp. SG1]